MNHVQQILKRPGAGLGVLIFNPKGQVLLGKRVSSHNAQTWSPIGGHIEFGETFEECALRESMEEAGLVPQNLRFVGVTNDFFEAEQKHYVSVFMKGEVGESVVPEVREPHKTNAWQWFDMDNLPQPLFLSLHKLLGGDYYKGIFIGE